MADEVWLSYGSGETIYACRFQVDGDVYLSNGSAAEVWGTGGHTANDYDVAVTEEDSSGHYVGSFDAAAAIGAGTYRVVVYLQAGASPADGDRAIAQGVIEWSGTAERTPAYVGAEMNLADDAITSDKFDETTAYPIVDPDSGSTYLARTGADSDTLETLSDQLDLLSTDVETLYGNVPVSNPISGTIVTGPILGPAA